MKLPGYMRSFASPSTMPVAGESTRGLGHAPNGEAPFGAGRTSCVSETPQPLNADSILATPTCRRSNYEFIVLVVPLLAASLATAVSLAIAAYAGWARGGLPVERLVSIALAGVAVLYVHLLPMHWDVFHTLTRAVAFVLWCVGLMVVLYGQVTFFVISQQHAGDQRAAMVPSLALLEPPKLSGPSRSEIALNIAKVEVDLARVEAGRCRGDCSSIKVRRTILSARRATLEAEADEAKRREAELDRYNEQTDRVAALRATLRADPVASTVAAWLGTTESRFELVLGLCCAVVLEGAAIIGWQLVSVSSGRAGGRDSVARSRDLVVPASESFSSASGAVVTEFDFATEGSAVLTDSLDVGDSATAFPDQGGSGDLAISDDDGRLDKIRQAVVGGRMRPTQAGIRNLMRCRQQEAGRLKRLYESRFGDAK